MSERKYPVEVIFYDETARELAPQYLPPPGSHCSNEEFLAACERLTLAVSALKQARRAAQKAMS